MPDAQVNEIIGRNRLVDELLRAGLEVAVPLRDRGIDLLAYEDTGDGVTLFRSRPIQMKAASKESFGIYGKYEAFPGLILAYVWNIGDGAKTVTYALTHAQSVGVADAMGYTKTDSWLTGRRYECTSISAKLRELMEPYRMTPEKWRALIRG